MRTTRTMSAMIRFTILAALLLLAPGVGMAQTTVTLPDTSQSTTLTANLSEQAQVTVPAGVTFNVTDISGSTAASAASVTFDSIVLATATKPLKVSIQADAAALTPTRGAGDDVAADDITWNWVSR